MAFVKPETCVKQESSTWQPRQIMVSGPIDLDSDSDEADEPPARQPSKSQSQIDAENRAIDEEPIPGLVGEDDDDEAAEKTQHVFNVGLHDIWNSETVEEAFAGLDGRLGNSNELTAESRLLTMAGGTDALPDVDAACKGGFGGAAADQNSISHREKLLQVAKTQGCFDLQKDMVGKWWKEAKASDPELRRDYDDLGKAYAKQRARRQLWVEDELKKLVVSRTQTDEQKESDTMNGDYEPFDIVIDKEGGAARESSIKAAYNYCEACINNFKAGKFMNGRSWVAWNKMTKRVEFLYLKKGYRQSFDQSWGKTVSTTADGDGNTLAGKKLGSDAGKPAVDDTKKGNGKKKRPIDPNVNIDEPAMKKKKLLAEGFKRLHSLKVQMGTGVSTSNDIMKLIAAKDPQWKSFEGAGSNDLKEARTPFLGLRFIVYFCFLFISWLLTHSRTVLLVLSLGIFRPVLFCHCLFCFAGGLTAG